MVRRGLLADPFGGAGYDPSQGAASEATMLPTHENRIIIRGVSAKIE